MKFYSDVKNAGLCKALWDTVHEFRIYFTAVSSTCIKVEQLILNFSKQKMQIHHKIA